VLVRATMGNNHAQDIFNLVAFDTSANSNFVSDNYGSTPLVLMVQIAFLMVLVFSNTRATPM
jgi:hypothetical protein